jgi:site-specific DNA-methyltransferase (adenine-specific)
LSLPLNSVIHGDCLEVLKTLPADSIDCLLTDPPYGINFISGQRKVSKHGKIANDDNLDWLEDWFKEVSRVLKPDAHSYIFCSHHNVDKFQSLTKKYLHYKNLLIWEKNSFGMGDLRGDYGPQHELIIFCSNGKKKLNGKRYSNILKFSRTGNKLHASEKPVPLFEFLLLKSTTAGDVVLDCFAGSGTCGIAAKNSGRNYMLIEKERNYYCLILERLN